MVGAQVSVIDLHERVVATRIIGGNVATGCRGPDTATLAIREAGEYRVMVRWSDGATKTMPVTLTPNHLTNLRFARDAR